MKVDGSHGTTCANAESIQRSGFILTENFGFWGHGVYFFFREKNGIVNSCNWYRASFYRGDYGSDVSGCAVLHATICCKENEHIDLNHSNFTEAFRKLDEDLRGRAIDDKTKNFMRNRLVEKVAEREGIKPLVLFATIPVPKRFFRPERSAPCIVVMSSGCISPPPYEMERISDV
ncbi:hypothetical protein [Fundidesulfovibrio butyratiphilus]